MIRMLLICCLFLGSLPVAATGDGRLRIFVSIAPQKYLVERIGGSRVQVSTMVQPGYSPEVYDPSPRQMAALGEAQLYFRICVPFEYSWIKAIAKAGAGLQVIDCSADIRYRPVGGEDAAPIAAPGPGKHDPHVWTSPENAGILARQVQIELTRLDPGSGDYYAANLHRLESELEQLDEFIRATLAPAGAAVMLVSHDSWGYYADRYGLRQVALESGGRERGPRGLARLLDQARRERIHTLFMQKQHRTDALAVLAAELGAELVEIDPLAEDYLANLRRVTRLIAQSARR